MFKCPVVFTFKHCPRALLRKVHYSIKVVSGTFGFATGEGLVNEFHGYGTILIQTRNVKSLAEMLSPFISSGS